MCGFTGLLNRSVGADESAIAQRMNNAIIHRGPDSEGYWHDAQTGISLAHRRLSILELSPAGAQPMLSHSGRYVIAFNGEIYNHLQLRRELTADWCGLSDTETLLAGFDHWGIIQTLKRSVGMFSFAVWDKRDRILTLARDRLGEKPLYYGWQGYGESAVFLFGSELKALRAHPAFSAEINRDALALFMRHNAIPAPYSIYRDIYKLSPGSLLSLSLQYPEPSIRTYWSGASIAQTGVEKPFSGTSEQAVDSLEQLLKNAVLGQMQADVPLGAFLSGGIDSTLIVALMQAQSASPIKTFTIGFHEKFYDEAGHARAVAKHLGTDHTELYITADQALDVIPQLPKIYDEPFADSSQIPTILVSQLARQKVTVSLSGDGGDELFSGYNRYRYTARMWKVMSCIPQPLRRLLAKALMGISPHMWNKLSMDKLGNIGGRLHKAAGVLTSPSQDALYLGLVSHWNETDAVVIGGNEPPTLLTENKPRLQNLSAIERMMALDMLTYLPDDLLTKVDRAAMSVSLETRMPFLDHRVVEFAWQLPLGYKLREGHTKWILRQVLDRYVPNHLIDRPKMGFGVPIDSWLRGPLKDWAEHLLNESRLRQEGYFHTAPLQQKWQEHLSGKRNWQYLLWDALMFQSWLEAQKNE